MYNTVILNSSAAPQPRYNNHYKSHNISYSHTNDIREPKELLGGTTRNGWFDKNPIGYETLRTSSPSSLSRLFSSWISPEQYQLDNRQCRTQMHEPTSKKLQRSTSVKQASISSDVWNVPPTILNSNCSIPTIPTTPPTIPTTRPTIPTIPTIPTTRPTIPTTVSNNNKLQRINVPSSPFYYGCTCGHKFVYRQHSVKHDSTQNFNSKSPVVNIKLR